MNPPLAAYLLAGISVPFGFNLVVFHLVFLLINALSVIGVYLLAARFSSRPFLAALLFLLCPAFLVSATSLMCEPLLVCLWIWSIFLWITAGDRQHRYLFGGLLLLAAVLTKFMALFLVPLLVLHAISHRTTLRIRLAQLFSLMIPIAGAIGYECYTARLYGTGAFKVAAAYATGARQIIVVPPALRLIDTLAFTGGSAAACFILLMFISRWRVIAIWLLIAAVVCLVSFSIIPAPSGWQTPGTTIDSPSIPFTLQFTLWTTAGLTLLMITFARVRQALRHRQLDSLFLSAWVVGVFIYAGFINWSINVRSLLPLLPPLCIWVANRVEDRLTMKSPRLIAGLVASAALAVAVTFADFQLARTAPQAADQLSARYNSPPTKPLYFAGHWGFQYYLQSTGAVPIDDLHPQFHPGDTLVFPVSGYGGLPHAEGLDHLDQLRIGPTSWLTATNPAMGANFYSSDGYDLPFVFGPIPAEAFDLVKATAQSTVGPATETKSIQKQQ